MDAGCDCDIFVAQDSIAPNGMKEMYDTAKITIIKEFAYFESELKRALKSLHIVQLHVCYRAEQVFISFPLEQITRRNVQYFCFSFEDVIV